MIYHTDKQSTQDIKKFLQPHTKNKLTGEIPKERKGTAGSPQNRHLPVRGQK
jgi:hypothetical protein